MQKSWVILGQYCIEIKLLVELCDIDFSCNGELYFYGEFLF